jgi:hypothetical protein
LSSKVLDIDKKKEVSKMTYFTQEVKEVVNEARERFGIGIDPCGLIREVRSCLTDCGKADDNYREYCKGVQDKFDSSV